MIAENLTLVRVVPFDNLSTDLPFYASQVSAGFPSPADDYIEQRLSLDKLVIRNPASTFFIRVSGNSMEGAGIYDQDIIVVDRSLRAKHNDIIVARLDGEFILKRLVKTLKGFILQSENPDYKPIILTEDSDFTVWGVVASNIRMF